MTAVRKGNDAVKGIRSRTALALLLALGAASQAGCKPPDRLLAFLTRKLGATPAAAPTPGPPASETKVEVVELSEGRTRGDSEVSTFRLDLGVPATKRGEVAAFRVTVRRAVDDLGTNLVPESVGEAQFESTSAGEPDTPVSFSVALKSAPRKAKTIRELSGEVEFYSPALDPDSLVTFQRFRGEAGKSLESMVLKASGVELALISPEQLEAEKKAAAEKAGATARKAGLDADTVKQVAEAALSSTFFSRDPGDVVLRVKDPKKRLQGFAFIEPSGAVKGANRSEQGDLVVLSSQNGEAPGTDWGLQVRLLTPKSLRRYGFKLANVPLP